MPSPAATSNETMRVPRRRATGGGAAAVALLDAAVREEEARRNGGGTARRGRTQCSAGARGRPRMQDAGAVRRCWEVEVERRGALRGADIGKCLGRRSRARWRKLTNRAWEHARESSARRSLIVQARAAPCAEEAWRAACLARRRHARLDLERACCCGWGQTPRVSRIGGLDLAASCTSGMNGESEVAALDAPRGSASETKPRLQRRQPTITQATEAQITRRSISALRLRPDFDVFTSLSGARAAALRRRQ